MKSRTLRSAIKGAICLCIALACFGSPRLAAQKFQYAFGGAQTEEGYGGVRALRDGGYIAVGESNTPSAGGNYDIYLVRTNGDGSLAWSTTYDLGGSEIAFDIEEVFHDPTGRRGFIIAGVASLHGCPGLKDIFLLRVDECGTVIWASTYGTADGDEHAWDVVEMTHDAPCAGRPGDFVVCGTQIAPNSSMKGYLIRVRDQAPANLLWARTYNGPCADGNDIFYGVTEAVTGMDGGNRGDIIVCGKSSSYCQVGGGGYDAFLAHLDGCGNMPNAIPYGASVQGGSSEDEFRSVIELTSGIYRGTIIAAGISHRDCSGTPRGDAYVVQTRSWPCLRVADLTLGDNDCAEDEAHYVREVQAPHPDAGQVIVTGSMTLPGGLGNKDVFAQRLTPGTLAPVAPVTRVYGGAQQDEGFSIMPVYASADQCFTDGYVIAGGTLSFGSGYQLYMIKTDAGMRSGCNERDANAVEVHPNHRIDCVTPRIVELGRECRIRWDDVCRNWEDSLCYDADGSQSCRAPRCPCTGVGFKPNLSGDAAAPAGSFMMDAYPNPVKRGSTINLECTLTAEAEAKVVVSDLSGREIYSHVETYAAGRNAIAVNTEGWSIGSYIVTLTIGDRADSRRIIVAEK
jgi:Secretion system C-terminal sorting domain